LRPSRAPGTSEQSWLNPQNRLDINTAQRTVGEELGRVMRINDAAWPFPLPSLLWGGWAA